MSDPMSSVEIEDVLSSIRRLVSDDLRPLHRPTPHPAAFRPLVADRSPDRVPPQTTDRLILTPALRVVRTVESPTKTVIAALEVAVEAQGEPWESETGDEAPAAVDAAQLDISGLGWSDDVWDEALERANRDQQEQAPAAMVLELVRTALPQDMDGESNQAAGIDTASWAQNADSDADGDAELGAEAAQGSVVAADPDWVAQAEAEVLATLADAAPEITEVFTSRRSAPPVDDADDDGITFDEEVLRDLVRDLIREELQGALGERITRNVRKLVRAEIARAIAAQAYE